MFWVARTGRTIKRMPEDAERSCGAGSAIHQSSRRGRPGRKRCGPILRHSMTMVPVISSPIVQLDSGNHAPTCDTNSPTIHGVETHQWRRE